MWHLIGSERLPTGLRVAIDDAGAEVFLSPISVWELGGLAERGRVRLALGVREWVAQARRRLPLREAPLTIEVALMSRELDLPHQDPADRLIAASAVAYRLTLLTVDQRLARAGAVTTRSR